MNATVIMSSPNADGLTAACAEAAAAGIREAGGHTKLVALNSRQVGMCQACGTGWGTCGDQHYCQVEDGFQSLHAELLASDALVLVTPVYWGEMSESCKALTDRLRRCQARRGTESGFAAKPMLLVAAAGGSGNGAMTCLTSMERWALHVRGRIWDLVPVKRWTREVKLSTIRQSAKQMTCEWGG